MTIPFPNSEESNTIKQDSTSIPITPATNSQFPKLSEPSIFEDIETKLRRTTVGYPITLSISVTPVKIPNPEQQKPSINIEIVTSMFSQPENSHEIIKNLVGEPIYDKYDIQSISFIDPILKLVDHPDFSIDNTLPPVPTSRIPGHTSVHLKTQSNPPNTSLPSKTLQPTTRTERDITFLRIDSNSPESQDISLVSEEEEEDFL